MMTSWPRQMKSGFMVLSQIDQACRDNWLKIYYQPLIDIQNMKLAECEALSHWIDPRYSFLSPGKFIPALEANREVYKVDCHALEGYGQDAEFLREIEITESALNDSSQAMVEAVQHFHDLGLPGLDG